jgi:purine-binding chemotaxis protein CheW
MEERHTQYLSFEVGGACYAAPLVKVREIVPLAGVTRVPTTPPWIRGVVNLRGQVLPVVDLAVKFGLPPANGASQRACVVVFDPELEGQTAVVGALVDAVAEVLELGEGEVEPPPAFGSPVRPDCLAGVASASGRLVLLLDTDRVLFADETLGAAAAGPASEAAGSPR